MDFCAETNEVSKRKTACREALEQPIECAKESAIHGESPRRGR